MIKPFIHTLTCTIPGSITSSGVSQSLCVCVCTYWIKTWIRLHFLTFRTQHELFPAMHYLLLSLTSSLHGQHLLRGVSVLQESVARHAGEKRDRERGRKRRINRVKGLLQMESRIAGHTHTHTLHSAEGEEEEEEGEKTSGEGGGKLGENFRSFSREKECERG